MAWCRSGGLYPSAYYPHNLHFLWASRDDGGPQRRRDRDREEAARAAHAGSGRRASRPPRSRCRSCTSRCVRFGKFDEMLAEPAPVEAQRYANGMWHYARGMAFAGKGQLDDARAELAKLDAIAARAGDEGARSSRPAPAATAARAREPGAHGRDRRARGQPRRGAGGARERQGDRVRAQLRRAAAVVPPGAPDPGLGAARDERARAGGGRVPRGPGRSIPRTAGRCSGSRRACARRASPPTTSRSASTQAWTAADITLEKPRF